MAAWLHRMARLAEYEGDRASQLEWPRQALDADKNDGAVALELADAAEEVGDWDTALKALQAVTLMKTSPPISHPVAFLRQARIAYKRGSRSVTAIVETVAIVEGEIGRQPVGQVLGKSKLAAQYEQDKSEYTHLNRVFVELFL